MRNVLDYDKFVDVINEKLITFGKKAYPDYDNVVVMAGGAGCFSGNTVVKTENGYKEICCIKPGEKVYTLNESTGNIELDTVEFNNCFNEFENPDLVELEFDNGTKIVCTPNHEFYFNGEWIAAKDLVEI